MRRILYLYGCLSLTLCLFGTHNRAGEILYKRIAPFTVVSGTLTTPVYTYSITVVKYTNHGSLIADRCIDTVYFGDGQKGMAQRVNGGNLLGCGCANLQCGELIINQPNFKVKKSLYSIIHTYSGSGTYLISSQDPNRNAGIINIPNSDSQPFYIQSVLIINSISAINASPVIGTVPIFTASLGSCFYYSLAASDADGDSLSYASVPCVATGYTYPDAGTGGAYNINPFTGLLSWCVPQLIGEYNVAIQIDEWRKNSLGIYQLIGSITRDMQIIVGLGVLDVLEADALGSVKVFPNPFNNELDINFGGMPFEDIEITLFTCDGVLVLQNVFLVKNQKVNLNTTQLESGIYFLRIKSPEGLIYKKLLRN